MNQEESEHNEVDGMKKGVDSKGEVMRYDTNETMSMVNLPVTLKCPNLRACVRATWCKASRLVLSFFLRDMVKLQQVELLLARGCGRAGSAECITKGSIVHRYSAH